MSWANELYQIFENFHDRTDFSKRMPPISHSTAKAQIEITIREDGTFSSAKLVEKEDSETVIPVTEDSCTRTSGVVPMPYAEKLPYIAGDYGAYTGKSNQDKYKAYVKQLASWDASEYTHPSVHALLLYVQKGCIIHDLVNSGLLKQNEDRTKLSDEKINGIAPEDVFLRFRVDYKNLECENCTWRDETLQKCFIAYQRSLLHNRQMCYATGEECLVTYKHPAKIRNAGDKAKLISANDERGFSYLGRFSTKNEAFSIGYEYSQKIHNALKWLVQLNRGFFCGDLTVIVWASAMQPMPKVDAAFSQLEDAWEDEDDDDDCEAMKPLPTTEPIYADLVQKMVFHYQKQLDIHAKVMVMGLDAATVGRLSIAMYSELEGSQFLKNLENWHRSVAWKQYDSVKKCEVIDSFPLYAILSYAFGGESDNDNKKLLNGQMVRLLPCVTEGRAVPQELVRRLVLRASNPYSYRNSKKYEHQRALAIACAMIRKKNLERGKGMTAMELDRNCDDRSYLFGRLLAVADKLERDTYDKGTERETNAMRFWNAFSVRPCRTWKTLRERLIPYFNKLSVNSSRDYQEEIQKICEKMTPEVFSSGAPLGPLYLLGYDHEMFYLNHNHQNAETKKEEE